MPSNTKKAKVKDIPGIGKKGGAARAAGRKIEGQKARSRDALSVAKSILMKSAQSTDNHQ